MVLTKGSSIILKDIKSKIYKIKKGAAILILQHLL